MFEVEFSCLQASLRSVIVVYSKDMVKLGKVKDLV